jgi:hypothetical protein
VVAVPAAVVILVLPVRLVARVGVVVGRTGVLRRILLLRQVLVALEVGNAGPRPVAGVLAVLVVAHDFAS